MDSREVIVAMLPPSLHVEVRERQNGSFTVHYPDPGFLPCEPMCDLGKVRRDHKHSHVPDWIETNYKPTDRDDAIAWAELLAEGRAVKIIEYMTPQARRRKNTLQDA